MKAVCFYHKDTGLFADRRVFVSDESAIKGNTPADHVAVEGEFDHLSQRVDVGTGHVIDYQPQQPSGEHEWNTDARRWQLNKAAIAKTLARDAARQRIAALEAQSGPLVRRAVLGDADARVALQGIEDEIAMLSAS